MVQLSSLRASFSSSKSGPLVPVETPQKSEKTTPRTKRSRALTFPLENPQKIGLRRIKQQTVEQDNSPLFRLPPELREHIWRLVLGGRCIAQDVSGVRVGDCSDPWPAWERVGGERRGLRPWAWKTGRPRNFISMLLTCRVIYSEAIHLLYSTNLFYFRNPFTHWSFSNWERNILPERLAMIRIMVLDETIGDPSIVFSNRKQWERIWRTLAKMPRLRVLYLNVDTLYPKAWTPDLERKLLGPLEAVEQILELRLFVRWSEPAGVRRAGMGWEGRIAEGLVRVDDYEHLSWFYVEVPEADMRDWIVRKLVLLEKGVGIENSRSRGRRGRRMRRALEQEGDPVGT